MAEALDCQRKSDRKASGSYENVEQLESDCVAANTDYSDVIEFADVITLDEDVWESMSNSQVHQSDVDRDAEDDPVGSTAESREREEREGRMAIIDALFAALDDDEDAVERHLRTLHLANILNNGAAFDDLLEEVLHDRLRRAEDHRVEEECQVCLVVVKLDKRPCCGQAVCQECLKTYVETQLVDAGVVRIGCPNPGCDQFVFQKEVRELLRSKPELRDRYDRWLVDLNADGRRKTCPQCCRITDVEPPPITDRRTAKYGLKVDCPDCQFRWCFPCQSPWHEGVTCAKNRTGDVLLKSWARQRMHPDEFNAQRCPKCKVYIQRISGCDHMKCNRCKTKFCYRCGGRRFKVKMFGYRFEDHDKKYSIIGCNDRFDDNKRLRRMCARGGIFGAKLVGGLIAIPMLCGAAGVAVAAAAVAGPFYVGYRLVKRARKRSRYSTTPTYDSDMFDVDTESFDDDDVYDTPLNVIDIDEFISPSPLVRRLRPTRTSPPPSRSFSFTGENVTDMEDTPPLPPRQPNLPSKSPRRSPPDIPSLSGDEVVQHHMDALPVTDCVFTTTHF